MTRSKFQIQSGSRTHEGRVRDHNEDNLLVLEEAGVWVVADGMGGHEAGEVASGLIVDKVSAIGRPTSAPDLQARVLDRIGLANRAIQEHSMALRGATVGATMVALLVFENYYAALWCGDSRIYRLRGGVLEQITVDHTEVQQLLAAGAITEAEAETWPRKNVITRAIGVNDPPQIDEAFGKVHSGDVFFLCSDGLTEHILDAEIEQALTQFDPQEACDRLIEGTLERGATDNVTVIAVAFNAMEQESTRTPDIWGQGGGQ